MWLRHGCKPGQAWGTWGGGLQTKLEEGYTGSGSPRSLAPASPQALLPPGQALGLGRGAPHPPSARTPPQCKQLSPLSTLAHRGSGKEGNEHLTGYQLLLRAPKAPKQPPCSLHRPHKQYNPWRPAKPQAKPHSLHTRQSWQTR